MHLGPGLPRGPAKAERQETDSRHNASLRERGGPISEVKSGSIRCRCFKSFGVASGPTRVEVASSHGRCWVGSGRFGRSSDTVAVVKPESDSSNFGHGMGDPPHRHPWRPATPDTPETGTGPFRAHTRLRSRPPAATMPVGCVSGYPTARPGCCQGKRSSVPTGPAATAAVPAESSWGLSGIDVGPIRGRLGSLRIAPRAHAGPGLRVDSGPMWGRHEVVDPKAFRGRAPGPRYAITSEFRLSETP